MKKRIIILITGLVVLMFAAGASARGFGPDGKRGLFFDDLKLTPKQEESFSKIRFEQRKKMIDLRAKMAIARLEYKELVKNRSFSTSKAKNQIEKITGIKTEIEMTRLGSLDQIRKLLTDEQWKIFSERKRHRGFHKKGLRGNNFAKRPHMPLER